jgi:hypothetical protein
MNQTLSVNIWVRSNRVSQLWDELLVNYVSPDPPDAGSLSPAVSLNTSSHTSMEEMKTARPMEVMEQSDPPKSALLEKAGFESLRLIRQALEVLTAPPEQPPAVELSGEQPRDFFSSQVKDLPVHDSMLLESDASSTYIRVSSEPEPQPGSAIDTRRMAYGLKIPSRPLHKRSLPQRLFFCLRNWLH